MVRFHCQCFVWTPVVITCGDNLWPTTETPGGRQAGDVTFAQWRRLLPPNSGGSQNHLSSTRGAGSSILNGSDGTLSRYTGWKKLKA